MPLAVYVAFAFLIGASIGSFLNVVIYRVPLGLSIVRPSSRCPTCDAPIRPHHNIPILGWWLARGRCAACGVPVSGRYPLVELAVGLLAVAVFLGFVGEGGAHLYGGRAFLRVFAPTVLYFTFVAGLVALAFIDLDWFVLPDGMTLAGIPLGLLTVVAAGDAVGVSARDALIGAGVGAGALVVVGLLYAWITGREGLGGGDWKLLGAIGAYLGWTALPFVLLAGAVQGLAFALAFRRAFALEALPPDPLYPAPGDAPDREGGTTAKGAAEAGLGDGRAGDPHRSDQPVPFRKLAVPFGPFLALAAIEYLLFRDPIRALYASLSAAAG